MIEHNFGGTQSRLSMRFTSCWLWLSLCKNQMDRSHSLSAPYSHSTPHKIYKRYCRKPSPCLQTLVGRSANSQDPSIILGRVNSSLPTVHDQDKSALLLGWNFLSSIQAQAFTWREDCDTWIVGTQTAVSILKKCEPLQRHLSLMVTFGAGVHKLRLWL